MEDEKFNGLVKKFLKAVNQRLVDTNNHMDFLKHATSGEMDFVTFTGVLMPLQEGRLTRDLTSAESVMMAEIYTKVADRGGQYEILTGSLTKEMRSAAFARAALEKDAPAFSMLCSLAYPAPKLGS